MNGLEVKTHAISGNTVRKASISLIITLALIILLAGIVTVTAAAQSVQWEKTYGGGGSDAALSVAATDDGYIATGYTLSYGNGSADVYLLKTDRDGNKIWNKTYGGGNGEAGYYVTVIPEGYLITGSVNSTAPNSFEVYFLKTDKNGVEIWNKTYGGSGNDAGFYIVPKADSYLIVGSSNSFGNTSGAPGQVYLIKTDLSGNMLWNKTYGQASGSGGVAAVPASDGYVVVGAANWSGATTADVNLFKIDDNGNMLWNKTFGATDGNIGYAIATATDGYVVAGATRPASDGTHDIYMLKTDFSGNSLWNKTFGDKGDDIGFSILVRPDGYVVAGSSSSYGNGSTDIYLVKTDPNGNKLWDKTVGGTGAEAGLAIAAAADGYVIAGRTASSGAGGNDVFLLKLGLESAASPTVTVTPATATPTPAPLGTEIVLLAIGLATVLTVCYRKK